MAIFSKPISVTYTCYELGHCWTPYCSKASFDVAKGIFTEALKIYGTLYVIAAIFKRKGLKHYVEKVVPETLRSTVFLTINGTVFLTMFCIWRKLTGVYIFSNVMLCAPPISAISLLLEQKSRQSLGGIYFLTASFIPSFIGSLAAILFERKIRRAPLAVYLCNLALETGFRMLVERKVVTPIAHGEVYIFSAVSAIYLYLFRQKEGLPSSASSIFSFFLGKDERPKEIEKIPTTDTSTQEEATSSTSANANSSSKSSSTSSPSSSNKQSETSHQSSSSSQSTSSSSSSSSSPSSLSSSSSSSSSTSSSKTSKLAQTVSKCISRVPILDQCLRQFQQWLEGWPKHPCCPHHHSCLSYITKGGLSMFAFGYSIQAIINTVSSLTTILRRPSVLRKALLSQANLKLAAFLASYNAVFRAVNCILRWVRNKDEEVHGMIAGALAGFSLRFYKSVTVALYAGTKLAEILYFKGIDSCGFPYIPNADVFLYAFSTAFIFHAAVMEPHTLRPGYWKFLLRVTHDRFAYMNRRLLDKFGVNSSKLYPNYWPQYDPRFSKLTPPPS